MTTSTPLLTRSARAPKNPGRGTRVARHLALADVPVAAGTRRRPSAARRLGGLLTVGGVILVLVAEFVLLHLVYTRADPARQAQVVASASMARLNTVPTVSPRVAERAISELVDAATGQADTRALRAAAAAYRAEPTPARLTTAVVAARSVRAAITARTQGIDRQTTYIYIGLLLVASVGWMVWFRRLVARHRKLERAVTETRSRAAGDKRLAALVRTSADAIVVCDGTGLVRYASPSVATVFGVEPAEIEKHAYTELVEAGDRATFLLGLDLLEPGDEGALRLRMRHANGRMIDVEGSTTNLTADPTVEGYVVTVRDVTERVRLEAALTRQAFQDSLTELANRRLFSDRLEHALEVQRGATDRSLVVLFCDLDDFKNVNDSLGHGVGDKVLFEIGRRIRSTMRLGDTVARFGGDEFAVLLEDVDVDTALPIATKLLEEFARPLVIDDQTILLGASVGLASAVAGGVSGDDLMRNADVAMYLAKSRGKGKIAVYDSELHSEALRRLAMRSDLRHAIDTHGIAAHFQPAVDVRTGRIVGFEALARWIRPDGTRVSPEVFVGLAEQDGLIHDLGHLILVDACHAAVRFNALSPTPISMSVNVTAQQMARETFVAEVLETLACTGMPPELLTLEITESEIVQDLPIVEQRLSALRARSIRIAIDDFGTGFSSLSYLRHLPVDALKIDKSFIDDITGDASAAALTQAIVWMSDSVGLVTVAEGVETVDQAEWLAGTDVSYAQGFLWSQALSADDAQDLLTRTGSAFTVASSGPSLSAVG